MGGYNVCWWWCGTSSFFAATLICKKPKCLLRLTRGFRLERGLPTRVFIRIWEWQFGSEEQTIIFLIIYGWSLISADGFGLWSLFKNTWAVKNNNTLDDLWAFNPQCWMLGFDQFLRKLWQWRGIILILRGFTDSYWDWILSFHHSWLWVFTCEICWKFDLNALADVNLVGTPPGLYFISSGLEAHRLHGCDHPTCARSLTFLIYQRGLLSIIAFQVQAM